MNETTTTPKKRGGPQPGSGRPPKDPDDRVIKCNISMTKAHHEATEGDRAGMIRRALDFYPKHEIDCCIIGKVYGVSIDAPFLDVLELPDGGAYARVTVEISFEGGAMWRGKREKAMPIFRLGDMIKVTTFRGESTIEVLNQPTGANEK